MSRALFLSIILWFGPGGAILPSRPLNSDAVARSGGQDPAEGLVLYGREHDGTLMRHGHERRSRQLSFPLPP